LGVVEDKKEGGGRRKNEIIGTQKNGKKGTFSSQK
jgi:hypothetical protein